MKQFERKTHGIFDAHLSAEALEAHARDLAAVPVRGYVRLKGLKETSETLRDVYMRVAAHARAGDDLEPAAIWMLDNYPFLEDVLRGTEESKDRHVKFPALAGGEARAYALVREAVAHTDALVDGDTLALCARGYLALRGMRMRELWALPRLMSRALLEAAAAVARQVDAAQKDRERASAAAKALLSSRAHKLLEQDLKNPVFVERVSALLREAGGSMEMLDQQLLRVGIDRGKMVGGAHRNASILQLRISNVVRSLHALEGLDWAPYFENLCPVELLLRNEKSGVYPQMDFESRDILRHQVEVFAYGHRVSEEQIARSARMLADLGAGRDAHVGYYLYGHGKEALSKHLGPSRFGFSLRSFGEKHARGLYMFLVWLISWAIPAAVLFWQGPFLALVSNLPATSLAIRWTGFLVRTLFKPRVLLKMDYSAGIPGEARTLVVVPTLLTSPEQARKQIRQLETHHLSNRDPNIGFAVLGDFADASEAETERDAAILEAAKSEVLALREKYGPRFGLYHRPRVWHEGQRRFMGRERKRGAIEDLNAYLLGERDDPFLMRIAVENDHDFAYILTIDADTILTPDAVRRMAGALSHPLHAPGEDMYGHAILAPRMESLPDVRMTRFQRAFSGAPGMDTYASATSEIYQDLCGQGIYSGKGIYSLRAFHEALRGKIPENAVLSHDLLEGLYARAALCTDIVFFDAQPKNLRSRMARQHRWTRGDWQLLPFLFRKELTAFDKWKIADNMRRSLTGFATMICMMFGSPLFAALSVWMLLGLPRSLADLRSFFYTLCFLPYQAAMEVDAACRALWRTLVSHRHMLDWVTAAQTEKNAHGSLWRDLFSQTAAGVLSLGTQTPYLAALWLPGILLSIWSEAPAYRREKTADEDRAFLTDIARRTWAWFEAIGPADNYLPPDNIQYEPYRGPARRTSPTNIGLAFAADVAARDLGFVQPHEMLRRMENKLNSLEKLELWKGHLYNWYATDSLKPLFPHYVSSVDSGNLAACLWAASAAARECGEEGQNVAERCEALLRNMNFSELFDHERRLFYIGFDAHNNQMGDAHYDLLASESRLLSYISIAKGDVPARHYGRPGRPLTRVDGEPCLLSWSGTMFEYLMPRLFLREQPDSLLDRSARGAVAAQIAAAKDRPWGESESGYYAFDLALNYQYKAFGIPSLSMKGGLPGEQVIAPYAALLALTVTPQAALDNLRRLSETGLLGPHGFFEAADYTPERVNGDSYKIIKSTMAHHQGMGLLALEYALQGRFVERFMSIPEIKAFEALLSERVPTKYVPARIRAKRVSAKHPDIEKPIARSANANEVHLLSGAEFLYAVDAEGNGFYKNRDIMITRFRNGEEGPWGPRVFLLDKQTGQFTRICGNGLFEGGQAVFFARLGKVEARLTIAVSPDDGTLTQEVALSNRGTDTSEIEITAYLEPVLSRQDADVAHRAFNDLFIEAKDIENGIMIKRRPRTAEQEERVLSFVCGGDGEYAGGEWSRMRFIGRNGSLDHPAGLRQPFYTDTENEEKMDVRTSNSSGNSQNSSAPIEPCAAIRRTVTIEPGAQAKGFFCAAYSIAENDVLPADFASPDAVNHAFKIANMRASVELGYLGIDDNRLRTIERAAYALLFPAATSAEQIGAVSRNRLSQSDLWRFGISGDHPIVTAVVSDVAHAPLLQEIVAAHEYWQRKGLSADLIFINDYGNDYRQPVRERLDDILRTGHLRGKTDVSGGAFIIIGSQLSATERDLIFSRSSLLFIGGEGDFKTQLPSVHEKESHVRTKFAPVRILNPLKLLQETEYGGFTENGREYVIHQTPPMPWSNVIANQSFGTLVTEKLGGYTWAGNSRECKLTPWSNDPVTDHQGEGIRIIRTDSALDIPLTTRCRHGQGYSVFEGGSGQLATEVTVFVDQKLPVKCTYIQLTNEGDADIPLEISAFAKFQLAPDAECKDLSVSKKSPQSGKIYARNGYRSSGVAFLFMDGSEGSDILHKKLLLKAGERIEASVLIGWAGNDSEADILCSSFEPKAALSSAQAFWDEFLSRVDVRTPDPALNFLINRWLPYQALSCRFWGKTGFYQAGGAWGFRDQLQDAAMLAVYEPSLLKEQILRCAAHQFEEGDVQHWWHEPRRGVRTRIRDDMLFLPWAVCRYISITGDKAILEEIVPYLTAPILEPGQEDQYLQPSVGREATIHQHCLAAINEACKFGGHGLPLIGGSDWNDAMNHVGVEGRGESIWLGWFLCEVLLHYANLCDTETKESFTSVRTTILTAIETHGWDGEWYRRAYYDDGTPMGTRDASSCEIDLIAQAWAAMTAAPRERAETAMNSAHDRLYDREAGVFKLLTPPFDDHTRKAGYIAGYLPGVRENGGQYTHGALWGILGDCSLENYDRAWETLRKMLPIYQNPSVYKVEPYIASADVYAGDHLGRGGWSWYTGSAAWMWRTVVEGLCGLQVSADGVRLADAMPGWPVEARYQGELIAPAFSKDRDVYLLKND